MGLDTSHDCWHGPYSSFGRWRAAVAKAAGLPVVEGAYGPQADKRWDDYHPRTYMGWWDEEPADILDVLIVHSDCEGYIFPHHAGPLADRLAEIEMKMPDGYEREKTVAFIEGLRSAADSYEVVVFS